MSPPPDSLTTEQFRKYLGPLKYIDAGYATPTEVAQCLIRHLAYSGDVDLFPVLWDSLPEAVRTEVLAYLGELASVGFARYISGVGFNPMSEEALLRDKERVRNNFARLCELAGVA
jgi:hypothetical protein